MQKGASVKPQLSQVHLRPTATTTATRAGARMHSLTDCELSVKSVRLPPLSSAAEDTLRIATAVLVNDLRFYVNGAPTASSSNGPDCSQKFSIIHRRSTQNMSTASSTHNATPCRKLGPFGIMLCLDYLLVDEFRRIFGFARLRFNLSFS